MKIFEFDPTTGRRGELIETAKCMSWTDCSVEFAVNANSIEAIDYVAPAARPDAEHTVHVDAGSTDRNGNDVSYRHPTEWRTFCYGCTAHDHVWCWVILPPTNAINSLD